MKLIPSPNKQKKVLSWMRAGSAILLLLSACGPSPAEQHYKAGTNLLANNRLEEAITELSKALELDPKLASAYSNRGIAYARKGEYEKAVADYEQALSLDPKYAQALFNRGIAYLHQGEGDKALAQDKDK